MVSLRQKQRYLKIVVSYSDNQKKMEQEDDFITIQVYLMLLQSKQFYSLIESVYTTILLCPSNLSLKVVLLFQSFLVMKIIKISNSIFKKLYSLL